MSAFAHLSAFAWCRRLLSPAYIRLRLWAVCRTRCGPPPRRSCATLAPYAPSDTYACAGPRAMACLESLRWRQACASACLCLRGGGKGGGCLLLPAITCGCASATACLCLSSTNFIRLLVHAFIRLCLRAVCGRLRSPTFIRRAFFAKKGKGACRHSLLLAFACVGGCLYVLASACRHPPLLALVQLCIDI